MTRTTDSPFQKKRSATENLFNEKREAVLARAAKMFAEGGFEAARLADVADSLGTSKASIYYYFRSKEEILRELHARGQEQYFDILLEAENIRGSGKDKLEYMFRNYVDLAVSDIGRCFDIKLPHMRTREREAVGRIIHLFELGVEDGSLRGQDPRIAVHAAFSLLNWLARHIRERGPSSKAAATDQVLAMIWQGVGTPTP